MSHVALPHFVHEHSKVLIEIPLRILAILVVAVVLRSLAHRFIDRLTRPVREGDVPRILRPLSERVGNTGILDATGLLFERRAQRAATVASVVKSFISITIFVITFLVVLSELGIDLAPFIAGTSIVGVALGFGAQSVVKDFLSGMFMIFEDQYGVGDVIDFERATGTVEAVGLRTTKLRDVEGTVWYVRNGEVVRVGNMSQNYAQVVLDIPIGAGEGVRAASNTMIDVARELHDDDEWSELFLGEPELVGVQSITRDETVVRLTVRVRPLQQWRVANELRRRIRDRL